MTTTPNIEPDRPALTDAVRLGEREGLEALRDELAARLADPTLRAYAAANLAARLEAVLRRLGQLRDPGAEVPLHERLIARRAARLAALAAPDASGNTPAP